MQIKKPTIIIYVSNVIAFLIFNLIKYFLPKVGNQKRTSILLINTGQIGDLMITSILLENDEIFYSARHVCLIIKKQYVDLFKDYNGKVKIIPYNYVSFKWNVVYKYNFLKHLHSYTFAKCYNLTAARGILNDEMALLSGAKETYCLNSNWRYLKKLYGRKMDSMYTAIIGSSQLNEYDKHIEVMKILSKKSNFEIQVGVSKLFDNHSTKVEVNESILKNKFNKFVVIAPCTSESNREWGIRNFQSLVEKIDEVGYLAILLGSKSHDKVLKSVQGGTTNSLVLSGTLQLQQIAYLIQKSSLFVGQDSGLTHIAIRLNIPVIAIIGGGMYGRFFPYKFNNNTKFLYSKMDCFGCEWNCIYKDKLCFTEVTVDDVWNQCRALLNIKT